MRGLAPLFVAVTQKPQKSAFRPYFIRLWRQLPRQLQIILTEFFSIPEARRKFFGPKMDKKWTNAVDKAKIGPITALKRAVNLEK